MTNQETQAELAQELLNIIVGRGERPGTWLEIRPIQLDFGTTRPPGDFQGALQHASDQGWVVVDMTDRLVTVSLTATGFAQANGDEEDGDD